MSFEPLAAATDDPETPAVETPRDRRFRRIQVLATTAILWAGFSTIAWFLRFKFWRIFASEGENIPAFSRAIFSLHPLIPSVVVFAGLAAWAVLHLRIRTPSVRYSVGLAMLALWCAAAGILCLAFFAPLMGLRVNL